LIITFVLTNGINLINNELMTIQQKDLNKENIKTRFPSLTLTAHDPIIIASDSDFSIFPGTGTPEDPYIIEGFNITTTSDYGIYIHDTTKYFIIRNCYVDADSTGIYIYNIADGTAIIVNNTCMNSKSGIILYYSDYITFINNTCSNNDNYGISLSSSANTTLTNNTCSNNNNYGICLWYSDNVTLTNNMCMNNNGDGISLYISDNVILTDNIFLNNGLYVYGVLDTFLSCTISNNYVNGKLLGYFTNINDIIIDDPVYGQLFVINSTNVTIKNQVITNTSIGINVIYSQVATLINNTCMNNNYDGIYLRYSDYVTVTNNTCSNNNWDGISLSSSDNTILTDNTFINDGLYISGVLDTFLSCTISNNYVNGKLLGYFTNINDIIIDDPIYGQLFIINGTNVTIKNQVITNTSIGINIIYSQATTLINNTCMNNNLVGIYLYHSDNATINHNFCFYNKDSGLRLFFSDHSIISQNVLLNNDGYGIDLSSSHNVTIYNNIFIYNNLNGVSQGYDSTGDNYWYNPLTKQGNYWSEWDKNDKYTIDFGLTFDLYPHNDTDNDSLNDTIEVIDTHTDPFNPDTDGDGYSDYEEVQYGSDPLDPDSNPAKSCLSTGAIIGLSIGLGTLVLIGLGFFIFKKFIARS
ncbi:MAG: NosD domain-containing protein, partial [Candidatus Heimdallarchaeaceae archaeon]